MIYYKEQQKRGEISYQAQIFLLKKDANSDSYIVDEIHSATVNYGKSSFHVRNLDDGELPIVWEN